LTAQVQAKFVEALSSGNYRHVACAYAGISTGAFHRWMAKAATQTRGKFVEFRNAVEEAETRAQMLLVAVVASHATRDPKIAMEMLSRRWPREWGKSDRLAVTAQAAPPLDALPDDELNAAIEARLEEIEHARRRLDGRREPLVLEAHAEETTNAE
jgi:hypothetical protein